uniref:Putative secreted protein n=1 Tax=Panstrongylus lignarius TaxID=156445 RepID=A0A224Y213_9HEMI
MRGDLATLHFLRSVPSCRLFCCACLGSLGESQASLFTYMMHASSRASTFAVFACFGTGSPGQSIRVGATAMLHLKSTLAVALAIGSFGPPNC